MPSVPLWVLNKHFTAINVTPQDVAANGALTDDSGGAISLINFKTGMEFAVEPVEEEIAPDNSAWENMVTTHDRLVFSLDLLQPNIGGDPVPMLTAYLNFEYFKVVFTFGSGLSATTVTFYMKRGRKGISSSGRGAARGQVTFSSIDVGASTLAVS